MYMGWKALSSLSFADVVSMCCLFYACEMTVIQEKKCQTEQKILVNQTMNISNFKNTWIHPLKNRECGMLTQDHCQ